MNFTMKKLMNENIIVANLDGTLVVTIKISGGKLRYF